MKLLAIDWVGNCPKCNNKNLAVETRKGTKEYLYEGDKVTCPQCDEKGVIEAGGVTAYAVWECEND